MSEHNTYNTPAALAPQTVTPASQPIAMPSSRGPLRLSPVENSRMGSSPTRISAKVPRTAPELPVRRKALNENVDLTSGAASLDPPKSPSRNDMLQKQCTDLYSRITSLTGDYKHLEEELAKKTTHIAELTRKLAAAEASLRSMEDDWRKAEALHAEEVQYYKESIDKLLRRNNRIAGKLELELLSANAAARDAEEKYHRLTMSFKALQSNLELEQNSKALLVGQIEYLTKERDFLLSNSAPRVASLLEKGPRTYDNLEPATYNGPPDINAHPHMDVNSDCNSNLELDSDSEGSVRSTRLAGSLAEFLSSRLLDSSSPIKEQRNSDQLPETTSLQLPDTSTGSIEVSPAFQFPRPNESQISLPSISPEKKKRQSLPAKFKLSPTYSEEFVLSPLKLTPHCNGSYFDEGSEKDSTHKRYLASKPNHSRYNSHDIVPIKVEFESQMRSSSAPDKELLHQLTSVDESQPPDEDDCDMAFMKLNGYVSKRDLMITESLKRSSMMTDLNVLSSDITKQEITKLKFELQLLKLHNEKLLSYIGFELQKQKKNIRKLSSKQNLRAKVEYSDAKLIQKLRNMLIHKKRILRLVSINPILSTKYDVRLGLGGLGLLSDDEDFNFKSQFISSLREDCDDYGFLKHNNNSNLRMLSGKNKDYLTQPDEQTLKKYRLQTFRTGQLHMDSSGEESFLLVDEVASDLGFTLENGEIEKLDGDTATLTTDEWESDKSVVSEVDYAKLNRFNQMRYLIMGKEHMQKAKARRLDAMVDENLKYKFLTIVIGIIIVGVRFTAPLQSPN